MKIGFTATQRGMTVNQIIRLTEFFAKSGPSIAEFYHGDCIGGDAEAHDIACGMIGEEKVWIHPPSDPKKRAFCEGPHVLPPLPYLKRNHAIVDACNMLVAAPKSKTEELRSGTWATVRYARKTGKRVLILEP